ncbi:cell wall-active antibiotics response protein LiaF, partial [Staphylococcus felis]
IGTLMILFTLLSNKYTLVILFVFIIFVSIRYIMYKRKPLEVLGTEEVQESNAFVKQRWFGEQKTPVYVYKWEDLQIQHAIGDVVVDMTKAANLKYENTIVVRHIVGKVQVIVPLNYNVKLNVAAFYGKVNLNQQVCKIENNHLQLKSEQKADRYTVNIFVSTFIGDVEVIYR